MRGVRRAGRSCCARRCASRSARHSVSSARSSSACAAVGDENRDVGAREFRARAANAFLLDHVVGVAHASGVDERQADAIETDRFAQHVARRAGNRRDDRAFALGQRVEQARLADIGPADDHDVQSVAQHQPRRVAASSRRDLRLDGRELLAELRRAEEIDFFLGKIEGGFEPGAQVTSASNSRRTDRENSPSRLRMAARAAASEPLAIRSATASAWTRSSLPLRKARSENSPGRAWRAPSASARRSSRSSTTGLPCACSSTTSSPVNECGAREPYREAAIDRFARLVAKSRKVDKRGS